MNPVRSSLPGLVLLLGMSVLADDQPGQEIEFNRDIRPILADHCFSCHGHDSGSRKAGLRLDDRDAAIKSGAITPENPSRSLILTRIQSDDPDEMMPPPHAKKPLSDQEKALLQQWILLSAPYQTHWSFRPVQKGQVPRVRDSGWPQNPIDHFVLRALERDGIRPSRRADRETLIRRVSFDLIGLPPTLAELDRFTADRSAIWYERVVDYYLSHGGFGERMALAWLDAARYGDTSVFHADGPRDMWPWRDWVINAYNQNMPFDQFTVKQIAGDLMPDASAFDRIASGFNRNHATTDEGGAIAEEWRVDYVVDRVKTTSNVWLGISMECGQCHDHKYDPVTQKEYYSFFAFFNQTTDPGMQSRSGNQTPVVNVPNPVLDNQVAALSRNLALIDQQLKDRNETIEKPFQEWLQHAIEIAKVGKKPIVPGDLLAHFPLDQKTGRKVDDVHTDQSIGLVKGKPLWVDAKLGRGFQIQGQSHIELGAVADFDHMDQFSYGCWVKPTGNSSGAVLARMDDGNGHRGWDLFLSNGKASVHLINTWPSNAIKVTTRKPIPKDQWSHVFATYDGSGKAAGVKLYFNGVLAEWTPEADTLVGTTKTSVSTKIGRRNNSSHFKGIVDDVRIYSRRLSETEVAAIANNDQITPLLLVSDQERTIEDVARLKAHFTTVVDEVSINLNKDKVRLNQEAEKLKKQTRTCMIMGEQEKPRETYLLMRGHYASPDKSQIITPNVPSVLPPLSEGAPRNRLGLAQWLVSNDHPLTARVTVNRYWTMLFGRGLVATPMDFGSQGAWPSHPELLDWLASDFRNNGWDIKRTLKQILMSSTYCQSSAVNVDNVDRDPENILLARGPRFRLQGEMIRDAALSVSGLLVDRIGGPGVKPYQPPGLWNEVSLSGNVRFVRDKGAKLYRKSMYIYWKRSSPHPGMLIFDAPSREKCVVQRPRTNTPLQALYALNGDQFIEAARKLAERIIQHGGKTLDDKMRYGFRLLVSRFPNSREMVALKQLYWIEVEKYKHDTTAAQHLLSIGEASRDDSLDSAEHAAWTILSNVLLNMDAVLTKS